MDRVQFEIVSNKRLTANVLRMELSGDVSAITAPGQFVEIKIDDCFLRRPISVCDVKDGRLTIIYKTVGKGTDKMSELSSGKTLDILTGLGNGYDLAPSGERPLLVGGGVGVPPLYYLAEKLIEKGVKPVVVIGFNTKQEVFLREEFASLGLDVYVATADGSEGVKGFVTDVIKNLDYTHFYACGPMPMFKAMEKTVKTDGQYSFEARMGCGFGACMGCSIMTKNGSKRVCKEGPVFMREEVIW